MLVFLLPILLTVTNAFKEYSLVCSDGNSAVQNKSHACCPGEDYCVWCARISMDYLDSCATHCRGALLKQEPHCQDCTCQPLSPQQLEEKTRAYLQMKDQNDARSRCPHLRKIHEEEEEEREKVEM